MEKRKILVTGMAGQIGAILSRSLGDRYEFVGIDRRVADDVDLLTADLADLAAIAPAFAGVDTVIHLGADSSPRASWEAPARPAIDDF